MSKAPSISVVSCINTAEGSQVRQDMEKYIEQIQTANHFNDKKNIENYSKAHMKIDQQIILSAAYYNNEVFSFSGVYSNPEFYPERSVRVLNRFYIDVNSRPRVSSDSLSKIKTKTRDPNISIEMIQQQISLLKIFDVDHVFVSREMKNSRWARFFKDQLTEKTGYNWHLNENLGAVCCTSSSRCWQHIISCNIKGHSKFSFQNEMSEQQYLNDFKN